MNLRCIAIDDEPLALNKVSGYISKTPFLINAGSFRSAFDAFDIISKDGVDLMFIDIDMPDINGIDFVKTLRKRPYVVFTTAFSEYALEGFRLDAADYLLKPIGYNEFLKSANKVRSLMESRRSEDVQGRAKEKFIFVKADHKINKINIREIIYIEGMKEYVRIHLSGERPLMPLCSMKTMEDQLPSDQFMRVHRSYIINLGRIVSFEHNRIIVEGKVYIPLSEQYRDRFHAFLRSHSLG